MTSVIYDDVNGRADVIVAGEWLHANPDDYASGYKVGYAAILFRDGWWSGGCTPIVSREVADAIVAQQAEFAEGSDTSLTWDGDALVYRWGPGEDDFIRSEPTPDGYDVGFGWTWTPVSRTACKEVIGDAPRVVTARFVIPQSVLDTLGESALTDAVQEALDELPGSDYVTPYVAVTVED